jgi:hypothetical protein
MPPNGMPSLFNSGDSSPLRKVDKFKVRNYRELNDNAAGKDGLSALLGIIRSNVGHSEGIEGLQALPISWFR